MNRFLRAVAVALCAAGTASAFAACGGNDRPGPVTPPPQEEEKPAKKAYDILSDDYTVLNGGADDADGLTLNSAVLELDKAVVLPFGKNAEWSVSFGGVLMPDGAGGGQFLNSLANDPNGRIYFGVNGPNNVLFMGVCVGDTYANYCWDVPLETLSAEHSYIIKYDGEYTLSVDGGQPQGFDRVNINQANRMAADGATASRELTRKICAVSGRPFVAMTNVGSFSHPCTNTFRTFRAETTELKGYTNNYSHPLAGKTIYYLGSSVTRGHGGNTDGTSFAEMTALLTGGDCVKEAISGTNLAIVNGRSDSYVERLSRLNLENLPDVLVVQLSTNDFYNNVPLGGISDGVDSEGFDRRTVTGALEYIIAKVKEVSPETRTVIYACPLGEGWGKYREYGQYVNGTLKELEEKWADSLSVLDLYNADYIKMTSYMQGDNLHPQKEGYAQVFTPLFIELLNSYFE